jgi:hypothetical protein
MADASQEAGPSASATAPEPPLAVDRGELYFLILRFLRGGPCSAAADALEQVRQLRAHGQARRGLRDAPTLPKGRLDKQGRHRPHPTRWIPPPSSNSLVPQLTGLLLSDRIGSVPLFHRVSLSATPTTHTHSPSPCHGLLGTSACWVTHRCSEPSDSNGASSDQHACTWPELLPVHALSASRELSVPSERE